jgi:SAM-dependent methyltransferase
VHAIDINQESLRHARALVNGGDHDVHVSCGSVLALPFADGAFDFAACLGVAHHTLDPEQAIAELARVLRPTGKLYLSLYCFAGSFFDLAVQVLRWVGARIPFGTVHRIGGRSRVMNNFVLDHMYVPTLWLFRAEEVRALLAKHHLVTLAEWTSQMDPWADCGWMGRRISGDGLLRIWLCEKP